MTVPELAFRMALTNLRNQLSYAGDFDEGGARYAYALMVLAREGAAAIGDLRYYADIKAGAFDTPLAAAMLGRRSPPTATSRAPTGCSRRPWR